MKAIKISLITIASVLLALAVTFFALSIHKYQITAFVISMILLGLDVALIIGTIVIYNIDKNKKEWKQYVNAIYVVDKEFNDEALKNTVNQEFKFENMNKTFNLELMRLITECHENEADVIRKAKIPEEVSKQMNDPEYRIEKKYIFSIALVLKLSLEDTSTLLKAAGYNFDYASQFDSYIKYYLKNKLYNIRMIRKVLESKNIEMY